MVVIAANKMYQDCKFPTWVLLYSLDVCFVVYVQSSPRDVGDSESCSSSSPAPDDHACRCWPMGFEKSMNHRQTRTIRTSINLPTPETYVSSMIDYSLNIDST